MTKNGTDTLVRFLEDLNGATTTADMTAVLAGTMQNLGFSRACYHVVKLEPGPLAPRLPYVMHNYGAAWGEHYFKQGYLEIDPVLANSPDRSLPFRWSELIEPEAMTKDQKRLFEDAYEAGIRDGFSVPIQGQNQEFAALSVVPEVEGDQADRLIAERRHEIHLLAMYFDRHARSPLINDKMSSRRQKSLLSPREQEMLRWTAQGKTSWEIAEITGIRAKSVEFHLENAKKKLGTYSKTHAVVKALTLGLIRM